MPKFTGTILSIGYAYTFIHMRNIHWIYSHKTIANTIDTIHIDFLIFFHRLFVKKYTNCISAVVQGKFHEDPNQIYTGCEWVFHKKWDQIESPYRVCNYMALSFFWETISEKHTSTHTTHLQSIWYILGVLVTWHRVTL